MKWTDELTKKYYTLGFLQVDIAKSSEISASPRALARFKEVFKDKVLDRVRERGGELLNWAGEGGSFMFPLDSPEEADRLCLAAIDIVDDLPGLNNLVKLEQGRIEAPINLRVSCDGIHVLYHSDHTLIHGENLNRFLKHERDIGVINAVILTERLYDMLGDTLRKTFQQYRYIDSLGQKLFARDLPEYRQHESRLANLNRLKDFVNRSESFRNDGRPVLEIVSLTTELPKLRYKGPYPIKVADHLLGDGTSVNAEEPRFNHQHAILKDEPNWDDRPLRFEYFTTDFKGLEALRGPDRNPVMVLSANVVLVFSEKREIILHRRTERSATYPGGLHTIGGAFIPANFSAGAFLGDSDDLISTAQRELHEELNVTFTRDDLFEEFLIVRELTTGFVHIVMFAGISQKERKALRPNPEGEYVVVRYDELEDRLKTPRERWVPTGRVHVLAWLALGAPMAGENAKFSDKSAEELFTELIEPGVIEPNIVRVH